MIRSLFYKLSFISILFLINYTTAYAQGCEWAKAITPGNAGGSVTINASATDASGNLYIIGFTYGDTTLLGTEVLLDTTAYGNIFVAKYDSSGNVLWAKSFKNSFGYGSGIAVDISGNVYISGRAGNTTFDTITIVSDGDYYVSFLAKFNSAGDVQWAKGGRITSKTIYPGQYDLVATDTANNIFLSGTYADSIIFDDTTLLSPDALNMFLVKYDPSGHMIWARTSTGTNAGDLNSIATDIAGNVIITSGYFTDTLTFDTVNISGSGFFMVKYSSLGSALWAVALKDSFIAFTSYAIPDAAGNIYLAGSFFADSIPFKTTTLYNTFTGQESLNSFLAKYDAAGNFEWAKKISDSSLSIFGMVTDYNGKLYMDGANYPQSGDTTLYMSGTYYLTAFDTSGNVLWTRGADSVAYTIGSSLVLDAFDHLYTTGLFFPYMADLDGHVLTRDTIGYYAGFVARYNIAIPDTTTTTTSSTTTVTKPIEKYTLYPNPATNELNISSTDKLSKITITNLLGQTLYSQNYTDTHATINVAPLPSGVYFLKINNSVTRKFVKE